MNTTAHTAETAARNRQWLLLMGEVDLDASLQKIKANPIRPHLVMTDLYIENRGFIKGIKNDVKSLNIAYVAGGNIEERTPGFKEIMARRPRWLLQTDRNWQDERRLNLDFDEPRQIIRRQAALARERGFDGINVDNMDHQGITPDAALKLAQELRADAIAAGRPDFKIYFQNADKHVARNPEAFKGLITGVFAEGIFYKGDGRPGGSPGDNPSGEFSHRGQNLRKVAAAGFELINAEYATESGTIADAYRISTKAAIFTATSVGPEDHLDHALVPPGIRVASAPTAAERTVVARAPEAVAAPVATVATTPTDPKKLAASMAQTLADLRARHGPKTGTEIVDMLHTVRSIPYAVGTLTPSDHPAVMQAAFKKFVETLPAEERTAFAASVAASPHKDWAGRVGEWVRVAGVAPEARTAAPAAVAAAPVRSDRETRPAADEPAGSAMAQRVRQALERRQAEQKPEAQKVLEAVVSRAPFSPERVAGLATKFARSGATSDEIARALRHGDKLTAEQLAQVGEQVRTSTETVTKEPDSPEKKAGLDLLATTARGVEDARKAVAEKEAEVARAATTEREAAARADARRADAVRAAAAREAEQRAAAEKEAAAREEAQRREAARIAEAREAERKAADAARRRSAAPPALPAEVRRGGPGEAVPATTRGGPPAAPAVATDAAAETAKAQLRQQIAAVRAAIGGLNNNNAKDDDVHLRTLATIAAQSIKDKPAHTVADGDYLKRVPSEQLRTAFEETLKTIGPALDKPATADAIAAARLSLASLIDTHIRGQIVHAGAIPAPADPAGLRQELDTIRRAVSGLNNQRREDDSTHLNALSAFVRRHMAPGEAKDGTPGLARPAASGDYLSREASERLRTALGGVAAEMERTASSAAATAQQIEEIRKKMAKAIEENLEEQAIRKGGEAPLARKKRER